MDEKKTDFKVTRRNKEKLRTVYACLNCRHRKVKVSVSMCFVWNPRAEPLSCSATVSSLAMLVVYVGSRMNARMLEGE